MPEYLATQFPGTRLSSRRSIVVFINCDYLDHRWIRVFPHHRAPHRSIRPPCITIKATGKDCTKNTQSLFFFLSTRCDRFVYSSNSAVVSEQQSTAAAPRVPPKVFEHEYPSPTSPKTTGPSPSAPPLPPKVGFGDDAKRQQQQEQQVAAPALPPKIALAAASEEASTSLGKGR